MKLPNHKFYTDHGSPSCAEVDPDLWFPDKGHQAYAPKRICKTCNVKAGCLIEALVNRVDDGIWGGLGHRERRRIRQTPKRLEKAFEEYREEVEKANETKEENK